MWELVMEKKNGDKYSIIYDPINNEVYKDGQPLRNEETYPKKDYGESDKVAVRISMGKNCNFKCAYCSQKGARASDRVVPSKYSPEEIAEQLIKFCEGNGKTIDHIQLWGGETLLYFDMIKRFHSYFITHLSATPRFFISTNGSLFKGEKFEWLRDNNFVISFSYDGPGQHLRGKNILEDPEVVKNVQWYLDNNPDHFQFAPVLTHASWKHLAIANDIKERIGRDNFIFTEAVPAFVESEESAACAIDINKLPEYGMRLYQDFIADKLPFYSHFIGKMVDFLGDLGTPVPIDNTRCFVNRDEVLTIDMNGNIQTCQNLNAEDCHYTGESYCYGNIFTDTVFPKPALVGLKQRRESRCKDCMVVSICKGGCPYMGQTYEEYNCASNFWHCAAILGGALTLLTNGDALHFWRKIE